jgi:CRP/FNR family transcriptional regulator, cyclic AMP receptor protein
MARQFHNRVWIEMTDSVEYIYGDLEPMGTADLYLDEVLEIIHHIPLFDGFNQEEIGAVCQHMKCYATPGNYILLQEGMAGVGLILILTGAAQELGRHDMCSVVVGPGNCLGEASFIDGKPNMTSYIATVPSDFALLSREGLNAILLHYPRLGNKLLLRLASLMATRLREVNRPVLASMA